MNIDSLLTDSVFQLIQNEFIKRSKKRGGPLGEQDYKVALQALVDRINEVCGQTYFTSAQDASKIHIQTARTARQQVTEISDSPAPATPEELDEINRRDEINKVNSEQARAEKLQKVADAVRKVFEQGGNRVTVPKDMVVSEIEPFLKSQGIHFASLQIGLPATEPGSPAKYWVLSFER